MNHQERVDFSDYGKSFQENLCQLVFEDRAFSDQIREVLNVNFLELKYLQVFVKMIFEYRDKYSVHPSTTIMTTLLRTGLREENDLIQKQVRDYFSRQSKTIVQDEEYIKATSLDFCKKQVLKEAILKSVPLLRKSSFEDIQKLINDAMKLGIDNDVGYDYVKDFEERFKIQVRNPRTFGWKLIDNLCKGGLGSGELGVVIAPTGAGKSMVLVHLGAQAVKEGKTVIHYTLELADTTIGSRYDSCITKVPLKDLHSFKEQIYEDVQDLEGKLIIKEYPTKSASPNTIRNHIEKLQMRDIRPDMIIVDYGDLLRPNTRNDEKRHELESIYEELRGIAQECKCPVWTASQTNRSGINADVITMESISEAFSKCFVADFIISVSRTVEDKSANKGKMFIAKNRHGPDGLVYDIFMDPSNVCIKVLKETNLEEIKAATAKEQKEHLKNSYKEFREKGKVKKENV